MMRRQIAQLCRSEVAATNCVPFFHSSGLERALVCGQVVVVGSVALDGYHLRASSCNKGFLYRKRENFTRPLLLTLPTLMLL